MTFYHNGRVIVWQGDCRNVLAGFEPDSFDSACVDPPYHFASIVKRWSGQGPPPVDGVFRRSTKGFMGKQWDGGQIAHEPETWAAVLRVLKPGAHLVAFHADKNYHRLVCAIEDAGFDIRHMLLYLYGSGFPKSHDVSKAIDRELGAERTKTRTEMGPTGNKYAKGLGDDRPWMREAAERGFHEHDGNEPVSELAVAFNGWGTALKPSVEPICLARKPLARGKTIAGNVMEYGTGALNIDACRVGTSGATRKGASSDKSNTSSVGGYLNAKSGDPIDAGRWPANVTHDGSPEVVAGFPETTSGELLPHHRKSGRGLSDGSTFKIRDRTGEPASGFGDSGSAARFFYTAKADADDRIGSRHPTIKPLDLIQWLCRLITPPKGHILDCFAGTGTTAEAALREGFRCTLIEREADYIADIDRRMALALEGSVGRSVAMAKLKPEGEPLPLFAEAAG